VRAILVLALTAVLTGWSIAVISLDSETAPFLAVAQRVESNGVADQAFLARLDRALAASSSRVACPRDLLRTAVTVKLARLEGAYRRNNSTEWAGIAGEAAELLRRALRCFPRDGNLWLRLATVEFATAGPTDEVERMVRLSAELAPGEEWILVPRLVFASKLIDFRPGMREVLRKDVQTIVSHARAAEVGALYLQVGERAREVFEEFLAGPLEAGRKAEIQQAIDAIVTTLPPEHQP
jgi:hypothetical protein